MSSIAAAAAVPLSVVAHKSGASAGWGVSSPLFSRAAVAAGEPRVAVLLDDTRLNYDAPDPDWTLIDIKQVEVLEGPQGPLYGTGAIGGIVKISTNRPALDEASGAVTAGLSLSQDSDLSNSQSLIANVALIPNRLGVRVVGYRGFQDGWIDNVGGRADSNREELIGGRMALRWTPATDWTVDLAGAIQNRRAQDSQYVDGSLGALD
jgi:outer membrane receptor for ferrienterochelin and colicin